MKKKQKPFTEVEFESFLTAPSSATTSDRALSAWSMSMSAARTKRPPPPQSPEYALRRIAAVVQKARRKQGQQLTLNLEVK